MKLMLHIQLDGYPLLTLTPFPKVYAPIIGHKRLELKHLTEATMPFLHGHVVWKLGLRVICEDDYPVTISKPSKALPQFSPPKT